MTLIVTLIANPANPCVHAPLIAQAQAAAGSRAPATILAEGIAAEFTLEPAAHAADAEAGLRVALADVPVDIAIQHTEGRRKKLFLADMDSTMIGQECIDELADFAGLREHVAAITERAMRGEIEFVPALRERVALLKGLPVSVVNDVLERRIRLTPGGPELVRTMRAHGAYTCLVSGGFTLFTGPIAAMIGFDEARANTLVVDNTAFSGSVAEPVFGREAKWATLIELRERCGLAQQETMAVGDGANDLDMIREAGVGVAYHAKPAVAAAAGLRIDYGDLTALLYLQGYRRDEFVSA